jgi:hypothetical protein
MEDMLLILIVKQLISFSDLKAVLFCKPFAFNFYSKKIQLFQMTI